MADSSDERICYDPTGNPTDDTPCSDSLYSTCCSDGWTCLDNKVCRYTGDTQPSLDIGTLSRGTCTDEYFQSDECPQFCLAGDVQNNGNFIHNCNNGTGCCQIGNMDCSCQPGDKNALDFGDINLLDSQSVSPLEASSSSSSTSASKTTSATSTTNTGKSTASATQAGDSFAASSAVAAPSPSSSSNGLSTGAKAGLGIGITLGVLLIAALVAWLILKRRRQRRRASPGEMKEGYATNPGYAPVDKSGKPLLGELRSSASLRDRKVEDSRNELHAVPAYSGNRPREPVELGS